MSVGLLRGPRPARHPRRSPTDTVFFDGLLNGHLNQKTAGLRLCVSCLRTNVSRRFWEFVCRWAARQRKLCTLGCGAGAAPGGIFNGKVWNYAIQRTDTSAQAARMHCMGHWYAIRGVKACSSFRWIKQFTHLSVAKIGIRFDWRPQGGDFQRQSLKLRYQTDRYKCASSAHALYGSQTHHPSCESVLIIPLDQAIDSPAR